VLAEDEPDATGQDGLISAQICEAIGISAREGRLVPVVY
jgi:hypothetical protein